MCSGPVAGAGRDGAEEKREEPGGHTSWHLPSRLSGDPRARAHTTVQAGPWPVAEAHHPANWGHGAHRGVFYPEVPPALRGPIQPPRKPRGTPTLSHIMHKGFFHPPGPQADVEAFSGRLSPHCGPWEGMPIQTEEMLG